MSYIGRKPTVGNFQICDAISVVNGQAAYTMQVGSVNVIPQSANHMIVSLNGTIQKPNSSFTVSGSTITFSSNLATGDVIDFIQILGDVLDLGVPSDATVSLAKLTATGTKSSSTFLRGDNTFAAGQGAYENQLLHVRDEKSSSTTGGASSAGDNTRALNTVVTNEISSASLSSNQITLPAGTYFINGSAPIYKSNNHKAYLYNVTDSDKEIIGTVQYSDTSNDIQTNSFVYGRFTITGTKVFEFRQYVSVAKSTNGLGIGYNVDSTINIYANVMIWKVA